MWPLPSIARDRETHTCFELWPFSAEVFTEHRKLFEGLFFSFFLKRAPFLYTSFLDDTS